MIIDIGEENDFVIVLNKDKIASDKSGLTSVELMLLCPLIGQGNELTRFLTIQQQWEI